MFAFAASPERALPRAALRAAWHEVAGVRVHALAGGPDASPPDALPVVCVHGWGVSGRYFVPAAERLAVAHRVHVPDLPGHGRSGTPRRAFDVPALADALVRWMDAVGIARATLVANSMGAQVAADAAVRHAGRVDRLVLVGPTVDRRDRTVLGHAWRLVRSAPFERPSLLPILARDYGRMHWRLVPELRAMLRHRMDARLPQVRVPALLVRGRHDAVAPSRWLAEMAALLGGPTAVVDLPRGGHAVHHAHPDAFVAAIAPFLAAPAQTPPETPAGHAAVGSVPCEPTSGHRG
jgi:pimeloyl-ACP methyl ester carboxylesterase